MHISTRVQPRPSRRVARNVTSEARRRAPPALTFAIDLHACSACGTPTTYIWFCAECQERGRPHRDDDPYDDLGGEGEA